jgi:transcriptional regulator with XRE-family HTH domain
MNLQKSNTIRGTIASRVKAARKNLGLTQFDFDRHCGIPHGSTNKIESGKWRPREYKLEAIQRTLKVDLI